MVRVPSLVLISSVLPGSAHRLAVPGGRGCGYPHLRQTGNGPRDVPESHTFQEEGQSPGGAGGCLNHWVTLPFGIRKWHLSLSWLGDLGVGCVGFF